MLTADCGYHSEANLVQPHTQGIVALIADKLMRRRDERFQGQGKCKNKTELLANKTPAIKPPPAGNSAPADFHYPAAQTCVCPAGKQCCSNGNHCTGNGRNYHKFAGAKQGCEP